MDGEPTNRLRHPHQRGCTRILLRGFVSFPPPLLACLCTGFAGYSHFALTVVRSQ